MQRLVKLKIVSPCIAIVGLRTINYAAVMFLIISKGNHLLLLLEASKQGPRQ